MAVSKNRPPARRVALLHIGVALLLSGAAITLSLNGFTPV
jgi:hypothetical protein